MIKGLFKFVIGTVGAVLITALIFVVSLVIGHAVTGSWNIREWKKSDVATATVCEYQNEQDIISSDNYTLNI
ncbi:MAG: hypothetical protein K2O41_02070 [Clostridia bacterium]|nr:hypothetical protein [Clostridia bacterium]